MPETQYMQSDWRRDHGFHSPDPLMTAELGIPNACTRCHQDQTVAWAQTYAEDWYGEKLEAKGYRERTRAVAAAREGDPEAGGRLLVLAREETNAIWRASLVLLMQPYLGEPGMADFLIQDLSHPDALVRASAVQALRPYPSMHDRLMPLRLDDNRQVRLNAIWATLERGGLTEDQESELREWLDFNSDDALGRLNLAQEAFRKEEMDDLRLWIDRMLVLDPSAGPMLMAGRLLHAAGLPDEASGYFEKVVKVDPDNVEGWFLLAMFRGEQGNLSGALDAFRRTVLLDPEHGRAWYNLGLAQIQTGDEQAGLLSLKRAETASPGSPDPAYAAATVYARKGETERAVKALRRALEQQPHHGPSLNLLRQLRR